MPKILIVGGGYAGFYTAWKLEKWLTKGEAEVLMVDPRPYLTYQPFLPEVAAGSVEPRHTVVSQRRHLRRTTVLTASVTAIDHATKTATITPECGDPYEFHYDIVVVTAGSVTRTFPIPGVADTAIGLKNVEEATYIRDRLINNFARAAALPADDPRRARLLTVTVVGGGFAGIEAFAELLSLASALLRYFPQIDFDETKFHLVEALGRIMPEVSLPTSLWVIRNLQRRGGEVHLETQLVSAVDGHVQLSTGESYESDLIVWTAGVMASPMLRSTDLPVEERGRLRVNTELQVVTEEGEVVEGAWGAGDASAVPDLSGMGVGGFCVPNAQHAVRQGKLLARNLTAHLRGETPKTYFHKSIGAVAGLGLGVGVYTNGSKKVALKGFIGWVMHRGYHGLAIPTWERKWRVIFGWIGQLFLRRDIVGLEGLGAPREQFAKYAARPRPAAETAPQQSTVPPGSRAREKAAV